MNNSEEDKLNTYVFELEIKQEEDGRWSAGVPALPGCATWGYTKEEALKNLKDAVEIYIKDLQEDGKEVPHDPTTRIFNKPVVAVTA